MEERRRRGRRPYTSERRHRPLRSAPPGSRFSSGTAAAAAPGLLGPCWAWGGRGEEEEIRGVGVAAGSRCLGGAPRGRLPPLGAAAARGLGQPRSTRPAPPPPERARRWAGPAARAASEARQPIATRGTHVGAEGEAADWTPPVGTSQWAAREGRPRHRAAPGRPRAGGCGAAGFGCFFCFFLPDFKIFSRCLRLNAGKMVGTKGKGAPGAAASPAEPLLRELPGSTAGPSPAVPGGAPVPSPSRPHSRPSPAAPSRRHKMAPAPRVTRSLPTPRGAAVTQTPLRPIRARRCLLPPPHWAAAARLPLGRRSCQSKPRGAER